MPELNFMDLQLRDLHLLQVMLSEGSLTRAAALLDTTQPALSKALARLRLQLGDPLLVRDGQLMRPTPKGAEMLTPLRNLLSGAQGLLHPESMPFDPRSSSHRFRLLLSDVGMMPLTGTTDVEHMRADLEVFDFRLAPDEVERIETLYPFPSTS